MKLIKEEVMQRKITSNDRVNSEQEQNYCSLKFPALRERSNNLRKGGLALRKYIVIVLGILLLLSFTALAYAEQDVKLGGRILIRGWYLDNVTGSLPTKTESQARYSTNVFIVIDAKVAENVQGFLELETCDNTSGTSGLYTWGTQTNDQKPLAYLFFRQAWIQYKGSGLLGVPAGIKAGHQLLTLGEKQFLRHERFGDDAIFVFVEPSKELFVGALTAKLSEGTATVHSDDIDAYALLGTYKLDKDNTAGLNLTWVKSDATTPIGTVVDSLNFYNLGLHANGLISGVTYAAEFDTQFGKAENIAGVGDRKFHGYGIFAKLGYKVDPVNLRVSFAMGSGDTDSTDNKNKEFQTTVGPLSDAQSLYARFPNYTLVYERATRSAASAVAGNGSQGQLLSNNTRTTGIANTTYYNAGLDIAPVKDLSLSLDGYLLRATRAWQSGQSKNVGTEVDAKVSYKLAKNLTYFVEGGVFSPGKYYTTGTSPLATEKKTATLLVHGLNLTF